MSETPERKCAVCGKILERGEHRICRKCVRAFVQLREIVREAVESEEMT